MTDDNTKHEAATDANGPAVARRHVLRGVAAGGAAIVGASGTTMAADVPALDSAGSVRAAFADHEDLLAELADRGLIEARTAADLTLDPFGEARVDGQERVRTARTPEGWAVPETLLVRRTERGWLTVGVRPTTGDRFASLRTDDGEVHDLEPMCCSGCGSYQCCAYDQTLRCIAVCQVCECYCA